MKIAITGKGGVGKTTCAGIFARILAGDGFKVLAIDADHDANLASMLNIREEELKGIHPLAGEKELIKDRTGSGAGGIFKLNPYVDDIPDKYSLEKNGVKLLILGNYMQGGSGCYCPENALLKQLMTRIILKRDEAVIIDTPAGLEHLSRGSVKGMDALVIVIEPGLRSIATYKQIKKMAFDLEIKKIFVVVNKIRSEEEKRIIAGHIPSEEILGYIPFREIFIKNDLTGGEDLEKDPTIFHPFREMIGRMKK